MNTVFRLWQAEPKSIKPFMFGKLQPFIHSSRHPTDVQPRSTGYLDRFLAYRFDSESMLSVQSSSSHTVLVLVP